MSSRPPNSLRWRRAGTIREIEAIRDDWLDLVRRLDRWGPGTDPDRLAADGGTPWARIGYRDGRPVALLAGTVGFGPLSFRAGYATVRTPSLRFLDSRCPVTDGTGAAVRESAGLLAGLVREGAVDAVVLREVPLHHLALACLPARSRLRAPIEPRFVLPVAPGVFAGHRGSHRRKLLQQDRRLERRYGGDLLLEVHREPADVERFLADALPVARSAWQASLGAGVDDGRAWRGRLEAEAARGRFLGYVLLGGGRPLAYETGWLYGDRYWAAATGFSPDHRVLGVGSFLFRRIVADLGRRGVREMDLGLGATGWKERHGVLAWRETTVHLFGASLRAEAAHAVGRASGLLRSAAHALTSPEARDRIKRALRNRWTGEG